MTKRIILGDGILGSAIQKQTNWPYLSRKKDEIDFSEIYSYDYMTLGYKEVINCIGFTDTYSDDRQSNWDINYKGVVDLTNWCSRHGMKLIHISTDYIYANSVKLASEDDVPCHKPNWYSYTKLLGDAYVQLTMDLSRYLLIRTSYKTNPFPHDGAYFNLVGNFDYIDAISPLIVELITKNACGVYNVGTEVKSMFHLAKRTKKDVKPLHQPRPKTMPYVITMDTTKMKKFLEENK